MVTCCANQTINHRPELENHTFLEKDHLIYFQRVIYREYCLNCKSTFDVVSIEGYVTLSWADGSCIKAVAMEWTNEGKLFKLWPKTSSTGECVN